MTEYLQEVLKYSVLDTGLIFLPMGVVVFTMSSFVAPRLMDRFGIRLPVSGGLAVATGGFILLSFLPVNSTYWQNVLPGITLIAFGFGASLPGLLLAASTALQTKIRAWHRASSTPRARSAPLSALPS
jgi:Na+/melibiose symporter-like transporter